MTVSLKMRRQFSEDKIDLKLPPLLYNLLSTGYKRCIFTELFSLMLCLGGSEYVRMGSKTERERQFVLANIRTQILYLNIDESSY